MADDDDQSSRTEEPSGRRLQQALERGQVTQSQDVKSWAALAAGTLVLAYMLPRACERILQVSLPFIDHPERLSVALDDSSGALLDLLLGIGAALAPSILLLTLCALGASLGQTGLIWAPSRIAPDPARVSPIKGLERLVSTHAVIELAKGLVKVAITAAVGVAVVLPIFSGLESWSGLPGAATLARSHSEMVRLAGSVAAVMTVIAILDYGYQRFSFMKSMRMTKQEVREEAKQSEGDPHIKGRIRRLRQERARQRMMAAVPAATVVITNPTHFAVALTYDMQSMPAPRVVAKGVDVLARRIRELAEEHGVPIVENPPLARALHGSVDVDQDIPSEHYQAVAEVIGYVMRLKRSNQAGRAGAPPG